MEISKVIKIEEQEVGYLEKATNEHLDDKVLNSGYGNYTKYMRDTFPELNGMAWCLAFQMWCFMKAYGKQNAKKILGLWTAKCSTLYDYLYSKKQIVNVPKKGDLVFFKNSSEMISHVGLVISKENNHIETIEGNTSGGVNTVNSNGDGVKKKSYNLENKRIAGYARLKYDDIEVKQEKITVTATNVNIRNKAGTDYKIIGKTTKGETFNILGTEYDNKNFLWVKIKFNNSIGFIRSDLTNYNFI